MAMKTTQTSCLNVVPNEEGKLTVYDSDGKELQNVLIENIYESDFRTMKISLSAVVVFYSSVENMNKKIQEAKQRESNYNTK